MTLNVVSHIDEYVEVKNVLISVSDKNGLKEFVFKLLEINPQIIFYSTGGTHSSIKGFLGSKADECLKEVSKYTGQPETQGGLVKTLDFRIYLGILTETYNPEHKKDISRTNSVSFDMIVVNLYPFKETISKPDVTIEQARGNIDIGGPCMIRASAKNFLRVASVVDPDDYSSIISEMKVNNGRTSLALRFRLAQKAFSHTASYDRIIADYLGSQTFENVKMNYTLET